MRASGSLSAPVTTAVDRLLGVVGAAPDTRRLDGFEAVVVVILELSAPSTSEPYSSPESASSDNSTTSASPVRELLALDSRDPLLTVLRTVAELADAFGTRVGGLNGRAFLLAGGIFDFEAQG